MINTIFDFIAEKESEYLQPVNIRDWEWSMDEHIKTTFFYKHGRLLSGDDDNKPKKNIIKPLLNLQYRTEDIDVKDISLFVNEPERYHLSFLIKRYHDDVFVKENNIDKFLDRSNVKGIDYGACLLENIGNPVPKVHDFNNIAFCDQTDMLAGPIGFRVYMPIDKLKDMEKKGWGSEENGADVTVDELIVLSEDYKDDEKGQRTKTTGKYVEVYLVYGYLPKAYLDGDNYEEYSYQFHVVGYYQNKETGKEGVTLFKSNADPSRFKLHIRDEVEGRAMGFGGAEELFEAQVWTNYNEIRMKDMLDAASKIVLQTDDSSIAAKHPNGLKDLDNLEIIEVEENKKIGQIDTFPRNMQLFEKSTQEWQLHAQQMAAANDSILGESPSSGTPFKLQELVTQESRGLHNYRRGQFAKFIEEVYRDWILPYIIKQITKDQRFLSQLSFEEMQEVADRIGENMRSKMKVEAVLNGENIDEEKINREVEQFKANFNKNDRKFIKILKDELKDAAIKIEINIVGKQHDTARNVDKMVNVFRQIASAPQMLDDPKMAKLFNQILESSGLDPINFGALRVAPQAQQGLTAPRQPQGGTEGLAGVAEATQAQSEEQLN